MCVEKDSKVPWSSTWKNGSSSTEMEQGCRWNRFKGEGKEFRGGHVAFDMLKSLLGQLEDLLEEIIPLQYSCLGSRMDRGVWGSTAHRCKE